MNKKPNFVLILADDMGYSDLGCYGSEINTPNLNSLGETGIRFTQMYNSARCCPSRAALLTGLNPQQTGVGHMTSNFGVANEFDIPAYQGYLNQNCTTIAEVLKSSGYTTLMSGKWHVGGGYDLLDDSSWSPGDDEHPVPTQRGFDKFYGIVTGAGSFYNPRTLMKNDKFVNVTESDFYFTDTITDNAITMIDEAAEKDQPFFLHLAYTAPHWPLHALEEDIAKYEGKYLNGWDQLRTDRHEELKGMGILDSKWDISPRNESAKSWAMSDNKAWEDLRMATYAAMIDRMDQGIGRVLQKLKDLDIEDDTVIMFLSDNGGCAEFFAEDSNQANPAQYSSPTVDGRPMQVGNIATVRPGPDDTFMSYDLPWANASNTPFRLFKRWTHEGGISTPFIVSWPNKIKQSSIIHEPTHITDIAATIYEAAGAPYLNEYKGHPIKELEGQSFFEAIEKGKWIRGQDIFWEHEGSRAMRSGEWKLVSEVGREWELYNMNQDRTELKNMAQKEKDRVSGMEKTYLRWMERCEVQTWPLSGHKWNPSLVAEYAHSVGNPPLNKSHTNFT